MSYLLGIDVGGTHTDAVILNPQREMVASTKQPTSPDIMQGISQAIAVLLTESKVNPALIKQAMLGTTHCTNAIVQRRGLQTVAHFRLGAPATLAIPPMTDIPADFRHALSAQVFILAGGYHYDGRRLAELDEARIRQILFSIKGKVKAISVCGVFAPVSSVQERRVEMLAREILGASVSVSLSADIGSIGLLERENATILNAALCEVAERLTGGFRETLAAHGIHARLWFGQNDGTLMSVEQARRFPVLTISSGPTNSICGAAKLTGISDAVVVDIGGTTTDIGALKSGLARQSALAVEIGGIRTNFRMPDIISIGLGGGSLVSVAADSHISIGPQSVGYQLAQRALVFGGDTLTVTDIAVACGWAQLGDPRKVAHLCHKETARIARHYVMMVEKAVERMNTSSGDIPVILVGGGACLMPDSLQGASQLIKPQNAAVANATGVAIARVSGHVDTIVNCGDRPLESFILEAEQQAKQAAMAAGAVPSTVEIVEVESLSLNYMPGNATRIRARAAGELNPDG